MIFDVANNVADGQIVQIEDGLLIAQDYVARMLGGDIWSEAKAALVIRIVATGTGNPDAGGAAATGSSDELFFDVAHVQWNQDASLLGSTVRAGNMKTVVHEYAHAWQALLGVPGQQVIGSALAEGIAEYVAYSAMVDAGLMSWAKINPFMVHSALVSDELDAPVRAIVSRSVV